MDTRELLGRFTSSFGNPDRMVELLAPQAEWWITPTVGILGSPTVGRDSIRTALEIIFGTLYMDVRISVHQVLVEGNAGAARLTMNAAALFAAGRPYENEYSLWILSDGELITHVWEYLDVAHAAGQFGLQR
ncbi:nuclear transport factor 2 family protein [Nocardia sp. NBC_00565]|uniref:nuclear transport factor 2 family protein n=1 Tax=Nocardia sp. NBC_00565 TaxID=2975993 RepID=UPI002E801F2E|nr:nuclear transport factor 2 family protein [Nocardia sp. NBC_00565]WUC04691.1 nuclear transport factor 2 family protein [Nocardia sp. NBC_00565]